jgi:hypothetical protein
MLETEFTRKCESLSRDVQVVNSNASPSVFAHCEDFRSQLDREIGNVTIWVNSELSSKCGDFRLQIDREIGNVTTWMSSELSSKCGDFQSQRDQEIGNVKSSAGSFARAQCSEVESQTDQNRMGYRTLPMDVLERVKKIDFGLKCAAVTTVVVRLLRVLQDAISIFERTPRVFAQVLVFASEFGTELFGAVLDPTFTATKLRCIGTGIGTYQGTQYHQCCSQHSTVISRRSDLLHNNLLFSLHPYLNDSPPHPIH